MTSTEKVHVTYIFVILIAIIVLVLTGWLTGISEVADKIQFGLALSSILLAVFTIIFAMLSYASLPHTLTELRGITKKVTKATTDLQSQLKAIPQRFDTMESKIEEQSTKFTEALQKSGTSDIPQPAAANLDPLIPSFLQKISINGCFALYAATLSFRYGRILDFDKVAQLTDSEGPYTHGFLIATESIGVIQYSEQQDEGTRITYLHPTVVRDVKEVLIAKWKSVFPDDAEGDPFLTSNIKALETHFMLPEEESNDK